MCPCPNATAFRPSSWPAARSSRSGGVCDPAARPVLAGRRPARSEQVSAPAGSVTPPPGQCWRVTEPPGANQFPLRRGLRPRRPASAGGSQSRQGRTSFCSGGVCDPAARSAVAGHRPARSEKPPGQCWRVTDPPGAKSRPVSAGGSQTRQERKAARPVLAGHRPARSEKPPGQCWRVTDPPGAKNRPAGAGGSQSRQGRTSFRSGGVCDPAARPVLAGRRPARSEKPPGQCWRVADPPGAKSPAPQSKRVRQEQRGFTSTAGHRPPCSRRPAVASPLSLSDRPAPRAGRAS